jgi:beta-N-acetylhexosaminidase
MLIKFNFRRIVRSFFLIVLILLVGCAGVKKEAPPNWVDQQLAAMTLEQKIGQMMVVNYGPRFFNDQNPAYEYLISLVKKYHIGGVSLARGAPYAVARTINRLQDVAEIPLFVMADMEWGVTMRVEEGTTLPPNMAIGATGSEDYAYQAGKITAREARAVGIQVGFVPVMDVNNNPDNIIINTRSYGENPELVARLGSAYIKGLQENGVYATAKHYPGHGNTNVDTHLGLPVIISSPEQIQNTELVPFKAAVKAGVEFVMVAHITYSSFPQMEGRPATLDSFFVKEVLRRELGFKGIVITDAMDMGGVVNQYWSGQAAVMAINAGMNMILMTPNFEATFDFVVQAVRDGRISINTINESVRRILTAKWRQGLYAKQQVNLTELEKVMASPQDLREAVEMSDASMTLIRDDKHIFPLHADTLDTVLLVTITDGDYGNDYQARLLREVRWRVPVVKTALIDSRSCQEDIMDALSQADSVQAVIVGFFVRWGSYKGSLSLPDTTVNLMQKFFTIDKPMAVVSFGTPYLLRQIPEVQSYLCAYDTQSLTVKSGIRGVFGQIPLKARLPVSIPTYYQVNEGLDRPYYKMEYITRIHDDFLSGAYAVLDSAIADSVFPGCQIAIVKDDTLIASRGFGHQIYDLSSPEITPETMYDLASVTKVAATTVVSMELYEQKKIRLDIPVSSYLPEFRGELKDSITVRNLLTHSAGLKAWDKLWLHAKNKEEAIKYIMSLPLEYAPGDSMVYSDLGIILMGEIIKTVTGESIDQLAEKMIYRPMGMTNTMYNPPEKLWPGIAPTEIGGDLNRGLIHGTVHDENTFFFGGVSTHAGLFSTSNDLVALAQMLINGGIYRHHRFFDPQTIREWTSRQNIPQGSNRALGWDTPADEGSSAGDYFSPGSFGHLGFTGTSIWIDPNRRIAIVLLTNRVYPTRTRGGIYEARRSFYNAAMKALLTEMGEEVSPEPQSSEH